MAKILDVSRVAPFSDGSPEYTHVTEFSLPLTCFDTIWFKFPPVERLFFYSLAEPKETLLSSVLPKLKHSLSLALRHFLPLAGTLTWPHDSPKPLVLYRAPSDGVSLSVAESDDAADFDVLCGDQPREAASFRCLVPELEISETGASVVSLQVTLFPNRGFCIGVTSHHAVLDGKSTTMFVKSWAHLCRENNNSSNAAEASPSLPPELTPFLDRSVVRDPRGLDVMFLNQWSEFFGSESESEASEPRADRKLFELMPISDVPPDSVRATFVLTRNDIAKLRQDIISSCSHNAGGAEPRLSAFVVAFSHALNCIARATENDGGPAKLVFGFAADFRRRIDPPVPENYFGNCVGFLICPGDAREIIAGTGEKGRLGGALAATAEVVSGMVAELEGKADVMEGAENWLKIFASVGPARAVGVAGSPRFGVYGVDFGWGRPRKVEIASIDRTGAVSMAESRDVGSGGVEVGLVLKKCEMDIFTSLFH